jgi:hypothetical protein
MMQHRCSEATLRNIDRALAQDGREQPSPSWGQRLADGFAPVDDHYDLRSGN